MFNSSNLHLIYFSSDSTWKLFNITSGGRYSIEIIAYLMLLMYLPRKYTNAQLRAYANGEKDELLEVIMIFFCSFTKCNSSLYILYVLPHHRLSVSTVKLH